VPVPSRWHWQIAEMTGHIKHSDRDGRQAHRQGWAKPTTVMIINFKLNATPSHGPSQALTFFHFMIPFGRSRS
jgi:hypothetical protein